MTEHHLDDRDPHPYWDREVPVRLEIDSGDVVIIECAESSRRPELGRVAPLPAGDLRLT